MHLSSITLHLLLLRPVHGLVANFRPRATFLVPADTHRHLPRLNLSPSTVTDDDGPTPPPPHSPPEVIDPETIPEMHYDPNNHPIPHQPWRRGNTNGCHDPIEEPWRLEAENLARQAVHMVGAEVLDVTWYLTTVVVTLHPDLTNVDMYESGPVVEVHSPPRMNEPMWYDPDNPPEENLNEDGDVDPPEWEEEYDAEGNLKPPPEWEPRAFRIPNPPDEEDRFGAETPVPVTDDDRDRHLVDTHAISVIGKALADCWGEEDIDQRIDVLDRHEVILTCPDPWWILETQKQYDFWRGKEVKVETRDPFDSNRTLRGKLVDRNAMDVILNVKGRMVTVPLCMVHDVVLPQKAMEDADADGWDAYGTGMLREYYQKKEEETERKLKEEEERLTQEAIEREELFEYWEGIEEEEEEED